MSLPCQRSQITKLTSTNSAAQLILRRWKSRIQIKHRAKRVLAHKHSPNSRWWGSKNRQQLASAMSTSISGAKLTSVLIHTLANIDSFGSYVVDIERREAGAALHKKHRYKYAPSALACSRTDAGLIRSEQSNKAQGPRYRTTVYSHTESAMH